MIQTDTRENTRAAPKQHEQGNSTRLGARRRNHDVLYLSK
jgi:hypothetical protein